MFSIINHSARKCCDTPTIWDKAALTKSGMEWADIITGVVLCIIGGLSLSGYYSIGGAAWMVGIGTAQMVIGLASKCGESCLECGKVAHDKWREFRGRS